MCSEKGGFLDRFGKPYFEHHSEALSVKIPVNLSILKKLLLAPIEN